MSNFPLFYLYRKFNIKYIYFMEKFLTCYPTKIFVRTLVTIQIKLHKRIYLILDLQHEFTLLFIV